MILDEIAEKARVRAAESKKRISPDVMAESRATTSGNGSDWKLGRNTINAPRTDSASAGIWIGESFSFMKTAASRVTKIGESLFNTVTSPCAAWLEA